MNTLRVGIASPKEMKERSMAIARGDLLVSPDDPKVWFTSPESFAKVLSNKNRCNDLHLSEARPALIRHF